MTDILENLDVYEAGAIAENDRIRKIMDLPEAQGREGLALMLALRRDVPVELARAILNTFPASAQPTFNVRPLRPPTYLQLASCTDTKGAIRAILS